MATGTRILLTPEHRGEYAVKDITQAAADAATKTLQENHEKHDIIFNNVGLHSKIPMVVSIAHKQLRDYGRAADRTVHMIDHIAHHVLTDHVLGASPDTISKHYQRNASYQRPPRPTDGQVVRDLQDPSFFLENLGKSTDFYPNYLAHLTHEIEVKGYEQVCRENLFSGDERANVMFARLFSGTLHPLIHFGFGIEFQQPVIVAEALGQTCIHPTWLDSFFFETDEAAKHDRSISRSLVSILDSIRADEELGTAAKWTDNNLIRDGVLARAKASMVKYASQWRVDAKDLETAAAEVANAAAYFTGAAQHPPKQVKFDFYFMHSVTSTIFLSVFLKQPWISATNKAKLLEYKGRMDLCQYASRGAPALLMDEIEKYIPKRKDASDWSSIIERVHLIDDDGHAAKLVRALAHGQRICRHFEDREAFRIKEASWLQLGNMAIDSVEDSGQRWVRSAGFDEAWAQYSNR